MTASLAQDFEKQVSIVMSFETVVRQVKTNRPPDMVAELSRTDEEPASDENAVGSRRAAWRIIARTERTETSETKAGEGTLVDVQVPVAVEETAEVSHEWEQFNKNKLRMRKSEDVTNEITHRSVSCLRMIGRTTCL